MPQKPAMPPDKLAAVGRALYGDRWQTSLARDLNVTDRTMRRWLVGESPIPDGIEGELKQALIKRSEEVDGLIGYSINPSDHTVYHYPSSACFQYDDDGHLTLLNPQRIRRDETLRIKVGAEEALRRDRARHPAIKFGWADKHGRVVK